MSLDLKHTHLPYFQVYQSFFWVLISFLPTKMKENLVPKKERGRTIKIKGNTDKRKL
jgi:hypothetical protein